VADLLPEEDYLVLCAQKEQRGMCSFDRKRGRKLGLDWVSMNTRWMREEGFFGGGFKGEKE